MSSSVDYKSRVLQAFSKRAAHYDKHAGLQTYAAEISAQVLANLKSRVAIPDGSVLEIGCGTGIFSAKLLELMPERHVVCSDLSDDMLTACRLRLAGKADFAERYELKNIDGECLEAENEFAMIASSFAFQWFFNPMDGLTRLLAALKPGGILLFSVPGANSCAEWKLAAERAKVPFTRNPMPSTAELEKLALRTGMEFSFNDHMVEEKFASASAMLRSLKELGANTQRHGLNLSVSQVKALLAELESRSDQVVCSYQIIAGYFRKSR